jgi:hypothetical protein
MASPRSGLAAFQRIAGQKIDVSRQVGLRH